MSRAFSEVSGSRSEHHKLGLKMDASAQLALMTKAKLVFESGDDTFLCFPALSPLSYPPDQLKFLPPTTSSEMLAFSEFCMLTNALPQGVLFQPSLDNLLWQTYLNVLQNAQLAQGTLTADQQSAFQQAEAFLYTEGSDGLPAPSTAVLAYSQYQQAYFTAAQNYKAAELTASVSTDPGAQAQWQNIDQPKLQGQVAAAESDWETKGFKAQVEQARQVEESCVSSSPGLKWQTWTSQCNPDIDFLTDSNNQSFAPTVYSPYDILDQTNWPTFTISGSEIQQLVGQAPEELTNVLGVGSGSSDIDSLSFEFCSVALSRPWFHPEVFSARFWRFENASEPLSDGNIPPQGVWPAYITALVFARNIVEMQHTTTGPVTQPVYSFPRVILQMPPVLRTLSAQPAPETRPVCGGMITTRRVVDVHSVPRMTLESRSPTEAVGVPTRTTSLTLHPEIMSRLSAVTFPSVPSSTAPPQQPPNGGSTSSQTTSGTQVSILAFICKTLPKCPNPDPSLNWGLAASSTSTPTTSNATTPTTTSPPE